jgi:outer membrane protein
MTRVLICLLLLISINSYSQKANLDLAAVIHSAQSQSPSFRLAETQRNISSYQYLEFKSSFKPQISLYGNLPSYSKAYNSVTQPDGTIKFLPVKQNYSNAGFSLSQQLPFSGGELSLNTDLSHFYDFQSKTKQYNGTPVFLRLSQPLFGFNPMKWQKSIEPLKLEESKRAYVEEMENIAQEAARLYFNVLDAQSNISIAEANLRNTQLNYEIEKKRVALGTTTEDKMLQLQLQSLHSRQDLDNAKYKYSIAQSELKTFTGNSDEQDIALQLPERIPGFSPDINKCIEYVRKYRPEFISFDRKKMEAQRDVSKAKAEKQQIMLSASYGYNRAADKIGPIYSDPRDQQRFSIGFDIPIVDWGRRSARYKTAKELEKFVDYNNELDEASMIQEVTALVKNFELLKSNIQVAAITDTVAARRYVIASNLYQVGKLTITDLNNAQTDKDNSRRSYISALREYWNAYYLLRKLTLYDFETAQALMNAVR